MGQPKHTSLTVRKLPASVKQRLRVRAARNGRSLEAEVREVLRAAAFTAEPTEPDLIERIHKQFAALGGVELELPPRTAGRPLPTFDE